MDILEGLNAAQRQAVETVEGALLIVAGPGSGKTRVITHRIAYLVLQCGVRPQRIMAVTFTNKAAREMRDRLDKLLGRRAEDLSLGTFHALCTRILRIEAAHAGLDRNFVIYDADDQLSLVKRAMKEADVDPKRFGPSAVRNRISEAKAKLLSPGEFAQAKGSNYLDEVVLRIYERYQDLLKRSNALDFDDLLMMTVRLLQKDPEVLAKYQERYVHVMIDEFQDTSMVQYLFAKLLAGKHGNLCVVGDPDQSIYSWRYAEVRNILDFERDYPNARTILLEQNYRSTQTILGAAGGVIARNRDRKATKLWTENPRGVPVTLFDAMNEQDEALFIVKEIERQMKPKSRQWGDFAVLYRTNAQSRPLEEAFVRYGVPYRLVGATRFYERKEIKDVLSYFRLLQNPYDDVSLLRVINVPSRGIGERTLAELTRWAAGLDLPVYSALQVLEGSGEESAVPPPEMNTRTVKALTGFLELLNKMTDEAFEGTLPGMFDLVMTRTGYQDHLLSSDDRGEERLENVQELRSAASEFEHIDAKDGLAAFLEKVALVSDVDNLDQKANSVNLITLHQAKGLEFPVVFMVGMEEGVLPHHRSIPDAKQMEEERRLCYVGITRARQGLFLLRAYRRSAMGQSGNNEPSRFLKDIPAGLIQAVDKTPPKRRAGLWGPSPGQASATAQSNGPAPFKAGDRVKHGSFGEGIVVSCAAAGLDHQVTVAFPGAAGVKKLLQAFANLEKVK